LPNSPIPKIEHLRKAKLAADKRGLTRMKIEMLSFRNPIFAKQSHLPRSDTCGYSKSADEIGAAACKAAPQEKDMVWLYELECSVASSPHGPPQTGGEPRGAPVIKRRSDWFAQCSPGPPRGTLPRTGSLLLLSARSRRSSDEPY
jgi:hypothetical protein